jgi:hypothetical protein
VSLYYSPATKKELEVMIKKNVLDFKLKRSEEKITARSGLAIFYEFFSAFNLQSLVNHIMPKTLSNHGFDAWEYAQSILLTLYGGGETLADTREIRNDEALKTICNIKNIPSESAVGDWLRRMGAQNGAYCIATINNEMLGKILQKMDIKEIALINDPSMIKAEKRDAFMTYEGYKGYRPAMIIIQELGLIAHYEFRDGNDTGRRCEFFKEVFDILPPTVKVKLVLMDSEFYDGNIFSLLIEKKIDFVIAAAKDAAVMETIRQIKSNEWNQCKDKDGVGLDKEYAETVHAMNTCHTPFRLIVLRWKDPKTQSTYCYHAIATNIENIPAQEVIWKYNLRSCGENDIKELKNGFGMHKMPCGDFAANAVYFGLGVLCHNLFIAQKFLTMPKEFHRKVIKSIRWLLVEVPGKIVTTASKAVVEVVTNVKKFEIFNQMRRKNYDLSTT